MVTFVRLVSLFASIGMTAFAVSAAADYEGPSGYGSADGEYEVDVAHSGYPTGSQVPGGEAPASGEVPSYVVIEVEDGTSETVDGETVIVVQEPEPVAATDQAPPPIREAPVARPVCRDGIWVDGYWSYADGQYVWIEGHCVVERVSYVFVHPRWDFYAGVWWFVPGYYRPCGVWVGFGYYRPWHWFPPYYHPYYRGYRGVPVHRATPYRRTVAHPASRRAPARAPTAVRRPPTRTGTVGRVPPSRTGTVGRVGPSRTGTVGRVGPSRTGTVGRVGPSRTGTVGRVGPSRTGTVGRAPADRTGVVDRPPAHASRTPAVGRSRSAPVLTRTAPRPSPSSAVVSRPRTSPTPARGITRGSPGSTRTGAVRRPSSSGKRLGGPGRANGGSRTSTVRRPGFGSGGFSRPSMGSSRPSFGGRPGGFSRPSGGFGGRSVPTARGR